jgi:hypothetical protein
MAKNKGKKKEVQAKVETPVTETPKQETPTPEVGKNQAILPNGEVISVRGPEKYRANYYGGNVGWQDYLRACRMVLNLTEYAIRIGADDSIVSKLMADLDAAETALNNARVHIPSDMTTRIMAIRAGLNENPVNSPDYHFALKKLSGLVKFVEDKTLATKLAGEVLAARKALQTVKA